MDFFSEHNDVDTFKVLDELIQNNESEVHDLDGNFSDIGFPRLWDKRLPEFVPLEEKYGKILGSKFDDFCSYEEPVVPFFEDTISEENSRILTPPSSPNQVNDFEDNFNNEMLSVKKLKFDIPPPPPPPAPPVLVSKVGKKIITPFFFPLLSYCKAFMKPSRKFSGNYVNIGIKCPKEVASKPYKYLIKIVCNSPKVFLSLTNKKINFAVKEKSSALIKSSLYELEYEVQFTFSRKYQTERSTKLIVSNCIGFIIFVTNEFRVFARKRENEFLFWEKFDSYVDSGRNEITGKKRKRNNKQKPKKKRKFL